MKTEGEPHDRLTRLSNVAIEAIQTHSEYREGDKAIILIDTGQRGGIGLAGYENTLDAFGDLMIHAKALAESHGVTVMVVPVGQG
jgi:hypothetical protein